MSAIMCQTALDEAKAFNEPADLAGGEAGILIHFVRAAGDGIRGQPDSGRMQLEHGCSDEAFQGIAAAGINRLLVALDKGGKGIGKGLVGAGQGFERHEELLQAGLETRFQKVIGEGSIFELAQVIQAEGEKPGAQVINLIIE